MRLLTIILLLTLLACDAKKNVDTNTTNEIDKAATPDKVVKDFYAWYLDKYYNADNGVITPTHIIKDKVLYLDTANYMNIIRTCGFFGKVYIDNQVNMFSACDSEMKKIDFKKFEECGCSPSEFTEHCEFMNYYIWLYHQGEDTKDIGIKDYEITGDTATVDIDLYGEKGDSTTRYQTLHLTLNKESSKWRITEIANAL